MSRAVVLSRSGNPIILHNFLLNFLQWEYIVDRIYIPTYYDVDSPAVLGRLASVDKIKVLPVAWGVTEQDILPLVTDSHIILMEDTLVVLDHKIIDKTFRKMESGQAENKPTRIPDIRNSVFSDLKDVEDGVGIWSVGVSVLDIEPLDFNYLDALDDKLSLIEGINRNPTEEQRSEIERQIAWMKLFLMRINNMYAVDLFNLKMKYLRIINTLIMSMDLSTKRIETLLLSYRGMCRE